MPSGKNISTGPRGAWRGIDLVMAAPGETIEADDFNPEWFEVADPLDHDRNGRSGGTKPEDADPATSDDITAAISLLDAGNDAHWTATGLPAVEAVASIAGKPVTRAAINEAAPDAKRPA